MLVIWGRSNSVNVQKVLWCCEEMSLPYERRDAGGVFGVVGTAEYRKLNPNGLVPTIDDDGFILWESHAIVRYLAQQKGGSTLWPSQARVGALADQWMEWNNTAFWPAIRPLFMGLVRTPPEKRDPHALEESRLSTVKAIEIFDAHLASNEFVAGDTFSLGDIPMGCAIWRWMKLPIERPATAHVARWFDALCRREAYQRIVMHPLT